MLFLTYDISNDKTRRDFSKFIKQYGRKLQYSVYEIKNSPKILQNIKTEIEYKYKKRFADTDSVLIFTNCRQCDKKVMRFGAAVHEEKEIVFF